MADTPTELKAHDIITRETAQFPLRGGVEFVKHVTFYVGDHGPFTLTYKKADYTVERVRADIQKEVDNLRIITSM